jgi:tellurite resistance protein TerC
LWIGFNVFVLGMLALDLGVFHRNAHKVSLREALGWSVVWISLALIFNAGIYYFWGTEKALEFLAGYLIEKSLSVDNIFVFLMIFSYFAVPAIYQHRVLFWGILGALVMRAIFIAMGAALLSTFHWMIYLFGAFLIVTGIKMLLLGDQKLEPERNPAVRLLRRSMNVTDEYHGQRFFVRMNGRVWATPLLLVLVVVETTDVIFAVDSIPAIFAITQDPFIVYTSNVFAILGLRALYFLLAGVMEMFRYLKLGLSFVLCFVGAKMLLVDFYKIPSDLSLGAVAGILAISVLASVLTQPRRAGMPAPEIHVRGLITNGAFGSRQGPLAASSRLSATTVWMCTGVIAALLVIVKWATIRTGPSYNEAIVIIRVAERDLSAAKRLHGESLPVTVDHAETSLEVAWSELQEKRYDNAMSAAWKASRLVRKMGAYD